MTTVFSRFSKDRSTEVKITSDDITWHDLSEEFLMFLQGCGYQVSFEDFAAYWAQYLPPEDLNDDIVIGTCDLGSCCGGTCETITASVTAPSAGTAFSWNMMGDQK